MALEVVKFQSSQDHNVEVLPRPKRQPRRAKANRGLPPDEKLVQLARDYLDRQRKCWQEIVQADLLQMLVVVAIMAITGMSVATTAASPWEMLLDETWTTQGQENAAGSQVALTGPGSLQAEGTGLVPPAFRKSLPHQGFTPKRLQGRHLRQSGCSRLVLVVSGCGGCRPGQNRDKSFAVDGCAKSVTISSVPEAGVVVIADQTALLPRAYLNPEIGSEHGPHLVHVVEHHRLARSLGPVPVPRRPNPPGGSPGPNWPPRDPILCDDRMLRSRARRKVVRTRAEIERERKRLLEKTNRELDAIVAQFHEKLPRSKAESIGSVYARYSSRFQDSLADQVRTLFEAAYKLKIFIPREFIYFDLAVRGWKDRRPGLMALRDAIKAKKFDVFLVFTTSRLFRRTYKSLQFVEEELVGRGIRGIFVKSHLDTADGENWRTTLQLFAAMDDAVVRMYAEHVRAAHEGLFLRGMVCTTLPLGYTGEVVPGEFTKRNRPRRRVVVDLDTAPWIVKIYNWYVVDGESLDDIARELNDDPDAPAPAKSLTGLWTHALVRSHLKNARFRGNWVYGAKQTNWSIEKDYAQQIPRPEPLKSGQFENLRVVTDDVWFRAQVLLLREVRKSGRGPKDGDRKSRPRLLRGLFVCPEHGRPLIVGGLKGSLLHCPVCRVIKAEKRPLFSQLNRALALRLTCEKLAELVRADDGLVADIVAECQREAEEAQKPDPDVLNRLRARAEKLSRAIDFNRRNPGEGEEEQRQTEQILRELRGKRTQILADLAAYEAAENRVIVPPTPEEVRGMLDELGQILAAAAEARTDEDMRTARRIIDELTGGRIELFQKGEPKAKRGWLQGRFKVKIVSVVIGELTNVHSVAPDSGVDVVIDYRAPRLIEEQAVRAKQLWDEGLLNKQIAQQMGLKPCYITKLLWHWFDSRGLPRPDNNRRRAQLANKQVKTPKYRQIADEVVRLVDEGTSNLSIARQLKVSAFSVARAIKWRFTSRGLPVPTAADRRLKMLRRAKEMYDSGMLIKDVAARLDYSPRGLTLALKKYMAELGESMPDGRARRGNAKSGEQACGHAVNEEDASDSNP